MAQGEMQERRELEDDSESFCLASTILDHSATVSTPTRFLLESGEWNLTPNFGSYFNDMNPLECQFPKTASHFQWTPPSPVQDSPDSTKSAEITIKQKRPAPPPAPASAPAPAPAAQPVLYPPMPVSPPTPPRSTSHSPPHGDYHRNNTTTNSNKRVGRKRRADFEEESDVEQRKKFLERNRVAAFKCRQKKKQWMQDLTQRAEYVTNQNKELHQLVAQLREESMFLRNQLLAHGNCDCTAVRNYIRKTSAQLTFPTSRSPSATAAAAVVAESSQMLQFLPRPPSNPSYPPPLPPCSISSSTSSSASHVHCPSSS